MQDGYLSSTEDGMSIAILSKKKESLDQEEWLKAKAILEKNPPLMTSTILLLALHSKPPLYMIQFMLELNPQAASIPKSGPTALQLAVMYHATHDVVDCLLRACPFALLATTCELGTPLELAKEHCANEPNLIAMLSQPLEYWMQKSTPKVIPPTTRPQEFDTLKVICSTMLRAQKRQLTALQDHKREVEEQLEDLPTFRDDESFIAKMLHDVADAQRKHFKTQLVALDMKERAVNSKYQQAERTLLSRLEETRKQLVQQEERTKASIHELDQKMTKFHDMVAIWQAETERTMGELKSQVKQESQVNGYFRKDTRLQLDQVFISENNHRRGMYIADETIVYSTPFDSTSEHIWEDNEPMLPKVMPLQEQQKKVTGLQQRHKKPWFRC